ncbi:MAG: hypothetical protein NTZ48_05650 [Candidatus Omnitrophica bacterium]|nr:hypothetical protein [Candidatus Omnitrophota bacterium]
MTIVYKVVTEDEDKKAWGSYATVEEAKVFYKVNGITVPPLATMERGYGLCVFKDLRRARMFDGSLNPIFECIALNPVYEPPFRLEYNSLRKLMLGLSDNLFQGEDWPTDTYMTDALIMVRRVR